MKTKSFITALLIAGAFFIISCGNKSHSHEHGDQTHADHEHAEMHGEGKEHTSTYVCPMHCEGSGSDEAGTCPVCGMDYVMHDEHVKDGHKH